MSPHYTAESGAGIVHTHTGGTMPLFNTFASHKTYIDPHTYEDPHQAVRQFAKELVSGGRYTGLIRANYACLRILDTSQ